MKGSVVCQRWVIAILLVGLAGCGSSATTRSASRVNRPLRSVLGTPRKAVAARLMTDGPYRAIRRGTLVPARYVEARSFADPRYGFGLANVPDGEGFAAVTSDGGKTWQINGPVFFAPAADGAAGVSYTGIASPRLYFAYGSSAVDVTTDGGRQWWSAFLGEVVLAVVAQPGKLVAVVQQTPSGNGSMTADTRVYVSTDGGRRWRYDNLLDAYVNVPQRPAAARDTRPRCQTGQVRIRRPAVVEGLLGTGVVMAVITNSSSSSCRLSGYPTVSLLDARHREVSVTFAHGALGPKEPQHEAPVLLSARGGQATFGLSFVDHAGPAPKSDCRTFRFVRTLLPGQHVPLTVPIDMADTACGGRPFPHVLVSPVGRSTRP
jgi:hypothetical protein